MNQLASPANAAAAILERLADEPPINGNNLAQLRVRMAAATLRSEAKVVDRNIEAAPDLLEALLLYEAWADKTTCRDAELAAIRKRMRAAIAKATQ